ncbi:SIR2 family protein [Bradyrhizobium sp. CIAT3101]|uniref:SIR2 family protein n=1 Tax=Bradyrhizobium sp. CIAT3101 TaxID=439387 RepID=UPI0024B12F8E|nr:SIR2 family protein [Bradyrhizobium sp. CIAT3101]WFU82988.1 SIR2 family protein [Bradyrhizobium sp. CIAT3101]
MAHYLLTGAGFSYNWGGWLASEAFEYLLGAPEIDADLRTLLWQNKEAGGGFEDALAILEKDYADHPGPLTKARLNLLIAAIVGMLNMMSNSMARRQFEQHNHMQGSVIEFLLKFEALFTLNQDTLLEQHYAQHVMLRSGNRYQGLEFPGMMSAGPPPISFGGNQEFTALRFPVADGRFTVSPQHQPYFKLHGSRNYSVGPTGDRIIIMGGNKAALIPRIPVLQWYKDEFTRRICTAGAKLMVIGYSFSDRHINDAISAGVDCGLKLFIIDPAGVDVIDKRKPTPIKAPDAYVQKIGPAIIGASRRPLTQIFNQDHVEWDKIMRFFA